MFNDNTKYLLICSSSFYWGLTTYYVYCVWIVALLFVFYYCIDCSHWNVFVTLKLYDVYDDVLCTNQRNKSSVLFCYCVD
jgi:hypothetical protein